MKMQALVIRFLDYCNRTRVSKKRDKIFKRSSTPAPPKNNVERCLASWPIAGEKNSSTSTLEVGGPGGVELLRLSSLVPHENFISFFGQGGGYKTQKQSNETDDNA